MVVTMLISLPVKPKLMILKFKLDFYKCNKSVSFKDYLAEIKSEHKHVKSITVLS